jgi:hypothetical protein
MNKDRIAYVAGLFDIGGCVRIENPGKGLRASLYVWITSKHFELMEALQTMGAHIGKKQDGQYRAKWRDAKAYSLLKQLMPSLIVRKEQARVGIEFLESRKEGTNNDEDQIFRIRLKLLKKDEEGEKSNAVRS